MMVFSPMDFPLKDDATVVDDEIVVNKTTSQVLQMMI